MLVEDFTLTQANALLLEMIDVEASSWYLSNLLGYASEV